MTFERRGSKSGNQQGCHEVIQGLQGAAFSTWIGISEEIPRHNP